MKKLITEHLKLYIGGHIATHSILTILYSFSRSDIEPPDVDMVDGNDHVLGFV